MKHLVICLLALILGCQSPTNSSTSNQGFRLTSDLKNYWFDGTAEISSFKLVQSRYGEAREGEAVLIYVTEDFLTKEQVKANQKSEK